MRLLGLNNLTLHAFQCNESSIEWRQVNVTRSTCYFCLAGHLSYRQMESVREVLRRVGTWDLVRLHCGEQLKGDYQGCQYIALNRQETDMLEFSRVKTLSADSLWALLGHVPQVSPTHWLWWATRTRGTVCKWGLNEPEDQQVAVVLYYCLTHSPVPCLFWELEKQRFDLGWRLQRMTAALHLFKNQLGTFLILKSCGYIGTG